MLALFLLASLCPTVQVCTFAYEMKMTIWTGSVGLLRFTFACCSCCFSSFPHLFRQHLQRTVHTKLKIVWSRKKCVSDMLYLHLFPRFFEIVRLLCVCVCFYCCYCFSAIFISLSRSNCFGVLLKTHLVDCLTRNGNCRKSLMKLSWTSVVVAEVLLLC